MKHRKEQQNFKDFVQTIYWTWDKPHRKDHSTGDIVTRAKRIANRPFLLDKEKTVSPLNKEKQIRINIPFDPLRFVLYSIILYNNYITKNQPAINYDVTITANSTYSKAK